MPTPDEAARLGIAAGTPVAEHIRTGCTGAGKPAWVMISIVPGDTLILQDTIPAYRISPGDVSALAGETEVPWPQGPSLM